MGSNAYLTQEGLRLDIKNMPPCTIFGQPWYKLARRFIENTDPENPNMITITGVPSQQELDSPLPQSAIVRLLAVCCVNEAIQSRVVEGLVFGKYGFTKNHDELKRIAIELNWPMAQQFVAEGLASGKYRFATDHKELKTLAYKDRATKESPFVKKYIETLSTPEEILAFALGF